jgi:polyisoprenoid-binding protein YceI
MSRLVPSLFATLLIAAASAVAAPNAVPLDTQRSRVAFEIRAMLLFEVAGRFDRVNGAVVVDSAQQTARVTATVDTRDVKMGRASYVDWIKSAEFFDVAHHPRIEFVSNPFPAATLDSGGTVSGELTVRGITRPGTFQLRPSKCPGRAAYACAVELDGVLRRSEFGMKSRRATLGDRVKIHLTIFAAAGAAP